MTREKPLFSVVIPVYNKEPYIAQTLESVLKQTFGSYEVIVVNDGSTDGSLGVVQAFTDPRVKVYSKANGGVSEARNHGIAKAASAHIAFLDADDYWEPTYLEEMHDLIQEYPSCGLYAAAYRKVKKTKTVLYGTTVPKGVINDFFKTILHHLVPWTSATVVKKSVFSDVGGFPVGMVGGEDDYTWTKIALKYTLAFTPKTLVTFNEKASSSALRAGKVDNAKVSWFDFYKEGDFYRNEYVARKAIFAGIRYAYNPNQTKSMEIEELTRYTILHKKLWWQLYILNRIPYKGINLLKAVSPRFKEVKYFVARLKLSANNFLMQFF